MTVFLSLTLATTAIASPVPAETDDDEPGAPAPIVLPAPTLGSPRPAFELAPAIPSDAKSPATALGLSLAGYLVPMTVGAALLFTGRNESAMVGGLVTLGLGASVGPSLGQFYVGNVGRGLLMSTARGALATGSYFMILVGALHGFEGGRPSEGLIAGGAILAAGAFALALWDIIDAPYAARRANARRGLLAIAPIVGRDQAGGTLGGLAVSGRF
jgi:hypothetical protein